MSEPLTREQYEPIRRALFERKNGSAIEARQAIADELAAAGLTISVLDGEPGSAGGCPEPDLHELRRKDNWDFCSACGASLREGQIDVLRLNP